MVERAQLIFATDFGRTSSELAKIFPNWLNFTQIGPEKTNHGSNSG
jgi:hypothetical protein